MTYPLLRIGHDNYVAVNTNVVPRFLRSKFTHPFDEDQWPHLRVPGPAVTAFPQLPFVLPTPPFASCKLLGQLSRGFVKKYGDDAYGMDANTCLKWKQLEVTLVTIIQHLCHYARNFNNVEFPSTFDPTCATHLPSALHFDRRQKRRYDSEQVIKRTHFAFELLIATVSFAIACATREDDDPDHPAWAIYLQDDMSIAPTIVDDLKRSPLSKPSAPRTGAVITRETDVTWIRHVPLMERFGCQLYIQWNDVDWWNKDTFSVLDKYRPTTLFPASQPSNPPGKSSRNTRGRSRQSSTPARTASILSWGRTDSSWGDPSSSSGNAGPSSWGVDNANPSWSCGWDNTDPSSSWAGDNVDSSSSWGHTGSSSSWGNADSSSSWGHTGSSSSWGNADPSSSSWGNAGPSTSWGNIGSSSWDKTGSSSGGDRSSMIVGGTSPPSVAPSSGLSAEQAMGNSDNGSRLLASTVILSNYPKPSGHSTHRRCRKPVEHDPDEIYAGPAGQFQDESMAEFFERRQIEHKRIDETSSQRDKQRIQSRARDALAHRPPGRKSTAATVFVWTPSIPSIHVLS